ncbi:MAG: DUF1071 domain-containing protein [Planctomycetaceae bacterium]|nr:DUF1071 domain-containing protein [Planctomycetaceae bacterium]
MKNVNYLEIWKKLSLVPVSEYIETKGGFDYLSWSRAWALLQESFPQATYEFGEIVWLPDGSAEVHCTITIEGCQRSAFLAVMDFRNKAIVNPTAKDIGDAKQRCFVKAIAMFGLGFSLYLGGEVAEPSISAGTAEEIAKLIEADYQEIFLGWVDFKRFIASYTGSELENLTEERAKKILTWLGMEKTRDLSTWPTNIMKSLNEARLND